MPQGAGSATSPAHQPSKHETEHDDTGGGSKRLHSDNGEVAISHGDVVPQTPQSVAGGHSSGRYSTGKPSRLPDMMMVQAV